jgi:hypothetical protein
VHYLIHKAHFVKHLLTVLCLLQFKYNTPQNCKKCVHIYIQVSGFGHNAVTMTGYRVTNSYLVSRGLDCMSPTCRRSPPGHKSHGHLLITWLEVFVATTSWSGSTRTKPCPPPAARTRDNDPPALSSYRVSEKLIYFYRAST